MADYKTLMGQAQALMAQAEQLRQAELKTVIQDIQAKLKAHGLTVEDLGARRAGGESKRPAPVKYRGPDGQVWSGHGRRPQWFVQAIAEGTTAKSLLA